MQEPMLTTAHPPPVDTRKPPQLPRARLVLTQECVSINGVWGLTQPLDLARSPLGTCTGSNSGQNSEHGRVGRCQEPALMAEGAARVPSTTMLLRPPGLSLQHSDHSWGVAGKKSAPLALKAPRALAQTKPGWVAGRGTDQGDPGEQIMRRDWSSSSPNTAFRWPRAVRQGAAA